MRTKYKSKFYFTAGFLLPAIILAISFALIKVWPFGEIRDEETAEIAVQASITGHLVVSTLHTNSAAGTITRMLNMGVE